MEHKHTPGPWSVRFDFVVQATSFDGGRLVPVAQPYGVNNDGTDLFANARLIAAAPDLLSSCQGMLEALETDCRDTDKWAELMAEAITAIAKATGSQP